ncbi:hypothetical protein D6D10_05782 [Aureobasidium pullulans]|uniref:Uncharacterized protein n=1 Tax=Aureobasidium pullulans TaxID=5580 RepID=A0A4S9EUS6_AURPU|nr:hypothetical protein D6D10_05782 [Aureobasidium pullulans]
MASNTSSTVSHVLTLFPHASEASLQDPAKYEQEVQLEMDRRGNFHGNHGNDVCCERRQSVPEVAEEELERRLSWARQMILQNPSLCSRSCQLPGLQEESR